MKTTDPFAEQLSEEGTAYHQVAQLDEWSECPGYGRLRYAGVVYNHPKFQDGTPVITGPVVWSAGGKVQTLNTLYRLLRRRGL